MIYLVGAAAFIVGLFIGLFLASLCVMAAPNEAETARECADGDAAGAVYVLERVIGEGE